MRDERERCPTVLPDTATSGQTGLVATDRAARRRVLAAILCTGFAPAVAAGPAQGVIAASGRVRVEGRAARRGTIVSPGMTVETGPDGRVVFVIGREAFLLRANSRIRTQGAAARTLLTGLRVLTGSILAVFSPGGPRQIVTPTLTMGVRGTAVYLSAGADETYACTCYGAVHLEHAGSGESVDVLARHHSAHRVLARPVSGAVIESAGMVDHTDDELIMLEALVGRRPPFAR